jgi:hypothetical protein
VGKGFLEALVDQVAGACQDAGQGKSTKDRGSLRGYLGGGEDGSLGDRGPKEGGDFTLEILGIHGAFDLVDDLAVLEEDDGGKGLDAVGGAAGLGVLADVGLGEKDISVLAPCGLEDGAEFNAVGSARRPEVHDGHGGLEDVSEGLVVGVEHA